MRTLSSMSNTSETGARSSRQLQLDLDKRELIWFCSWSNLIKLGQLNMSLNLCSIIMESVDSVRDLGAILEIELRMTQPIRKLSSMCFFHLRRLHKLWLMFNFNVAVISPFLMLCLDYCNAVHAGLPGSTLTPSMRA